MSEHPAPAFAVDFDPAVIRERYREEVNRRAPGSRRAVDTSLRRSDPGAAGADQWAPRVERESVTEDVEMLIIGGGFAGLLTAARAREAGVTSLRIIEAAGDFGGVWYWNRYPNAQCDTEAYVYLPLLEETGYQPSRRFPYAKEIFEHAQRIGRHLSLYECTLFHTEAQKLVWDEADAQWTLTTDRGDTIRARYVMYSRGAFGVPRYPSVPGLESFPGEVFHASRWNYEYTGGEPGVAPDRLGDKRVAIIGSAATGVQVVSALASVTGQLYVIQRTPTAFLGDRDTATTDPEWFSNLSEGWQRARRQNFDGNTSGVVQAEDLVQDTWSTTFSQAATAERILGDTPIASLPIEQAMAAWELADMEIMERARAYARSQITDPELLAKLEPWYALKCKRLTFDDGYLNSFNRDNVTLIDAPGAGLERVEGNRLFAGGEEFEVDCIVLATGFDTTQNVSTRVGIEIVGRDGVTLAEHTADGLRSLHGVLTDGFPNLFATGQGQDPFAVNYTSVLAVQSDHIAALLRQADLEGARTIEPTAAAVTGWQATIDETSGPFRAYQQQCVPSYFNADGNLEAVGALAATAFTPGVLVFEDLLRDWRSTGFEGLLFDGKAATVGSETDTVVTPV